MKKLLLKLKKVDLRHYICLLLTILFVIISLLYFPYALGRFAESVRDLWNGIKCYFYELILERPYEYNTITNLSNMPFKMMFNLPNTWEEFKIYLSKFWELFKSGENIREYSLKISDVLYNTSNFLLFVLPFILAFVLFFNLYLENVNNDYDVDSKPLKAFKKFELKFCKPFKEYFIELFQFIKKRKYYFIPWVIIWGFSFNLFSIVISFLAFYFYFVATFDFASIFRQLYKLLFDISPMVDYIPVIIWCILGYLLFNCIRKRIALKRLNHWEMQNRGFINSLPIVVMGCGTMGSKKTTMITDMGLSQEVMFRDKAFELILENDLKFPNFPWINLENALKKAIEYRFVYNLATCKKFIDRLENLFYLEDLPIKKSIKRNLNKYGIKIGHNYLFNYDYERYGFTYNDKLKIVDVWSIIKTYSQLYFVYTITSSLLVANYSIRTDNVISDVGNFPLWNTDFFNRDTRLMDSFSRHSHILDFDSLRLGKKVLEDNPLSDVFEFGIVLVTEVGKERGNAIENKGKKKDDEKANPLNDLFDNELKMIRHSSTIDNVPFSRVFTDEQRPESWSANARDLCQILHMETSSELLLAMPFFDIEELLYGFVFNKFIDIYSKFRHNRGDNTLLMYLIKGLVSKFHRYYKRIYNRFGYMNMSLFIENGTQDGQVVEKIYKLMVQKIYSKRFSTDCHSGFFYKKALRSNYGLDDIPEYSSGTATAEELELQHSYFIADLNSGLKEFEEK